MAQGQEVTKLGKEGFRKMLDSGTGEFIKALPNSMSVDNFKRVALTTVLENPKLLDCEPASLMMSYLKAAQLGLNCDGLLGEAHLVPFNDKKRGLIAQMLIGYKGLIGLALNTGKYEEVGAEIVFEKDPFRISLGSNRNIEHEPFEGDRGEMKAAYSYAVTTTGKIIFDFMWANEIEWHKEQYSRAWKFKDSIWQTNPPMAWKKTVIRKLCGGLQLSVKARQRIAVEEKIEVGLEPPQFDSDVIDILGAGKESGGEAEDNKKDTGISGAENILSKKNADLKGKAGKIEKEVKKHVQEGPMASKSDEMKKADLQDAIQAKFEEMELNVPWRESFDVACVALFGDKATEVKTRRKYDIGEMGLERVAKVWNRIK